MLVLAHLASLLILLALASCRTTSAADVVEFWAMGREGEVVQQLLPEFERRTPGVQVRVQQIPWSAAHEKLLTAYVGNAMPDLFQAGNTWIPELVALGAVEPLDERMARSATIRSGNYFAGIMDTNVLDGLTYGIPWYVDTRLLFYRTDLLALAGYPQPPQTWDTWREVMQRIKQRTGSAGYAILLPLTEWQVPVILALQRGATLLRDNGQYGDFRSPACRAAFDFYVELFHHDLAPRAGQAQVANLYQEFASGYFSMYISGPWNIGEFRERLPADIQDHWATAPMPAADGTYPGVSVAGGASFAVFRGSHHKELAWKVIEYLSEPAQQARFYQLTGDLPARQDVWANEALTQDRYARAFWEQLQHVESTPKIPEWERIATAISEHAEAAVRGTIPVDAALASLDAQVDQLLAKRRWMLRHGRGDSE